MGLFDFMKKTDINNGLKQYDATPGAVLLDVRTPDEYKQGRIPGSKNIPLQVLDKVETTVKDKSVPLFVYCLSGGRSQQAVSYLQRKGYKNVTNLGGISDYKGKVEK